MKDTNQTNQLEHNNCEDCYWFNQCKQAILCEDFTTYDESFLAEFEYDDGIKERYGIYEEILNEMETDV